MPTPILLSTWRFGLNANRAGWPHLLRAGGLLDALEAARAAADLDPEVDSVGVGGLPDPSGQVSLDGAIMLSPAQSAGVAYVRQFPHPVSIARRVMEQTPHKLLVGDGAEEFALARHFAPATLLTDAARKWEAWKTTGAHKDFHTGERPATTPSTHPPSPHLPLPPSPNDSHDTLGVLGIDAAGQIGVACTTSGRAYKLPGRVGDSPLIGAGLYCDPAAGAAVATGTGELMIGVAASFLVVERLRAGDRPIDAIRLVLQRVADSYPDLAPAHQCALIALAPDGRHASGALRPGFEICLSTAGEHQLLPPDVVLNPNQAGA